MCACPTTRLRTRRAEPATAASQLVETHEQRRCSAAPAALAATFARCGVPWPLRCRRRPRSTEAARARAGAHRKPKRGGEGRERARRTLRELDGSVRFLHVSHGDEARALQFLFGAGKGVRRLGELRSRGRLFLRDSKESGTYRPHARVEGHRSELQGILVPSQILTMVRHRVPRPAKHRPRSAPRAGGPRADEAPPGPPSDGSRPAYLARPPSWPRANLAYGPQCSVCARPKAEPLVRDDAGAAVSARCGVRESG